MYTPKERVELLINMLVEQLNEHGHFFKISKSRLSWRNKDVAIILTPRGSHYSTAERTSRWLRVQVDSHAIGKLHRAGAPVRGCSTTLRPQTIYDDDLRTGPSPTQVELTDWWSIEAAAKLLASQFDQYWSNYLKNWISHEHTIEFLSRDEASEVDLAFLYGPSAPSPGSDELRTLIMTHNPTRCQHRFALLGELLLATGKREDVLRLHEFSTIAAESNLRRMLNRVGLRPADYAER